MPSSIQTFSTMTKEIVAQIHDYDSWGLYRIVEERKITEAERIELKHKARESVKTPVDWSALPKESKHIVYYAELLDNDDEVWYVGIYLKGESYDDEMFYKVFNREDIGYVGAIHKRD